MITVMGATGHTGRRIALSLLVAGVPVRALGRSRERLQPLADAGAEVHVGDANDVVRLTAAFRGADAAYLLQPHDHTRPGYEAEQAALGEATAQAVRDSGLRHVVFLSSLGAEQPSGTGPIVAIGAQERRLRAIDGLNLLALRAGMLFENFEGLLDMIAATGGYADAIAPDLPVPMVATRDIADVAARALQARDWTGAVVRELTGPRDLTYAEAVRILGAAMGRPDLTYTQIPYEALVEGLTEAGFAPDLAALYADMARGLNEGRIRALDDRDAAQTPTDFADYVRELLEAR